MKRNFIHQNEENDCGYAVTAMIVNCLQNQKLSIEELKFDNQFDSTFLSVQDIKIMLEKYNISLEAYSASLNEITKFQKGISILYLKNKYGLPHFVVCYEINKRKFLIADPGESDLKWWDYEVLQENYDSLICVIKKTDNFKIQKIKLSVLDKIIHAHIGQVVLVMLPAFFLNMLFILSSNFSKIYFDNVTNPNKNFISMIYVAFICVYLVSIGIEIVITYLDSLVKHKIYINAMSDFFVRFNKLSDDEFEKIPLEKWILKLESINFMISYKLLLINTLPVKALLFTFAIISIEKININLLFFTCVQNILMVFIAYQFNFIIRKANYKLQNLKIKNTVTVTDIFYGHESIMTKNLTTFFNDKIKNSYENFGWKNKVIDFQFGLISRLISILSQGFYYLITYLCIPLIVKNDITVGDLIYFFSINQFVGQFSNVISSVFKNRSQSRTHFSELKYLYEKDNSELKVSLNETIKEISLFNVTKYRDEKKLFLEINKNFYNKTLVVGKSGIGKSTIFKIITGMYCIYSGKVLINNRAIETLSQDDISKHIFYLGQYDYLFSDSVFENIKLFTEIDLQLFTKYGLFDLLANHNIMLDRNLKNNGANLSKGQRQIINFMATFFINKDVFIIDESLSNVDEGTAIQLLKIFLEIHSDCVIIMCSHNPIYRKYFLDILEVV